MKVKIVHLGAVRADAGKSRSKYAHGAREDEGAEGVSGCWKSRGQRELGKGEKRGREQGACAAALIIDLQASYWSCELGAY